MREETTVANSAFCHKQTAVFISFLKQYKVLLLECPNECILYELLYCLYLHRLSPIDFNHRLNGRLYLCI